MACQRCISLRTRLLPHWTRINTCAEMLLRSFVHWELYLLRGSPTDRNAWFLFRTGGVTNDWDANEGGAHLCCVARHDSFGLPALFLSAWASLCNSPCSLYYHSSYFQPRHCCGSIFSITKVSVQYHRIDPNPRHQNRSTPLWLPYYPWLQQCTQSFSGTRHHHWVLYNASKLAIRWTREHKNLECAQQPPWTWTWTWFDVRQRPQY